MRQARALLPYALTALVVVTGSVLALAFAVVDVRDLREAHEARESAATATATPRSLPDLSRASRLAYWRVETPSGPAELHVANLDGSLRRPIVRIDSIRRVTLTRWLPTGDAIAYVERSNELVRVELDGTRSVTTLRAETRASGYERIVDHRWSPDGSRVVVTAVKPDLRSDVFVATADEAELTQLTTLEDVFATDWLDDGRVLVNTGGGVIGVLTVDAGPNAIRPLVGLQATSPILADDGRVHFLHGQIVPSPRDATLPYLTASGATVWSVDTNGHGLRQETRTAIDDVRLDARYDDRRYLAHRGSSSIQLLVSESVAVPPTEAGTVERVVVATDGRSAVGFTASRMLRFEVSRAATSLGFVRPTVLLDRVAGGDVWHARGAAPAAGPAAPAAGPDARYAVPLGGHLWLMGRDGAASFLRARSPQAARRQIPLPAWSPDGQRILAIELAGPGLAGVGSSTPVAVAIDLRGEAIRFEASRTAVGVPSWAPDGSAFVVVVDRRGIDAFAGTAELEARFLGLDGRTVRAAIPARDATWTRAGVVALTERAVELHAGAQVRTIVEVATVLGDPRGGFPGDRQSVTLGSLTASADGSFGTFRLNVSGRTGPSRLAIAVVRLGDGAVTTYLPGGSVQDLAWSPTASGRFGLTLTGGTEPLAQVRDAATDGVLGSWPGRFAGWSPDGRWALVSRAAGLYAFPVAGGDGVHVSTIGAPVSATALR